MAIKCSLLAWELGWVMLTGVVYDLYNCWHEVAETLYSSWQDARLQDMYRKQLFRTLSVICTHKHLVVKRNITGTGSYTQVETLLVCKCYHMTIIVSTISALGYYITFHITASSHFIPEDWSHWVEIVSQHFAALAAYGFYHVTLP